MKEEAREALGNCTFETPLEKVIN